LIALAKSAEFGILYSLVTVQNNNPLLSTTATMQGMIVIVAINLGIGGETKLGEAIRTEAIAGNGGSRIDNQ
jgi:hypothetical protein